MRSFVVPTADKLPDIFGMNQAVGEFRSTAAARAFVHEVRRSVGTCNDRQLSLEVRDAKDVDVRGGSADIWRIAVGTSEDKALIFRVALVRVGNVVSQLTFTPSRNYDIRDGQYVVLTQRVAARLHQA